MFGHAVWHPAAFGLRSRRLQDCGLWSSAMHVSLSGIKPQASKVDAHLQDVGINLVGWPHRCARVRNQQLRTIHRTGRSLRRPLLPAASQCRQGLQRCRNWLSPHRGLRRVATVAAAAASTAVAAPCVPHRAAIRQRHRSQVAHQPRQAATQQQQQLCLAADRQTLAATHLMGGHTPQALPASTSSYHVLIAQMSNAWPNYIVSMFADGVSPRQLQPSVPAASPAAPRGQLLVPRGHRRLHLRRWPQTCRQHDQVSGRCANLPWHAVESAM